MDPNAKDAKQETNKTFGEMAVHEIVDLLFEQDRLCQSRNMANQSSRAELSENELSNKMQNLSLENSTQKEKAESSRLPKSA